MTTFARSTFSAKAYAAFRPAYPPSVFRTVLNYHQLPAPGGTLLDLGCGHGIITRYLRPHFKSALAIDPSVGMIAQAQQTTADPEIVFRQGSAEDLSFLSDGSVDMAVAGQAAHWFDYGKVWPNLARVVRPGGTVAFWGYKDNVLLGTEHVTEIMEEFIYGFDEVAPGWTGMGPCWEQPGRNILRDLLRSVRPPESDWADVKRLEHEPGKEDTEETCWLRKNMKLGEVDSYLRTFSCFIAWKDEHPDVKSRTEGGDGDIIDVMWDRIIDTVPEWKAMGGRWREAEVISDWGTYILMARRR
ncbi:S-adenosyl-L-methionine-dependent methyltransferase [Annulohypoxylon maeteangense]|uniref:S-adenosyl-L-methionine-dependent methyltransferase n=1 Tax=Annulohypoxylon maeteangense TaxID=1927788 RepID=UPI002007E4A3|nr:S-adenosyl-L-methionine-dependent methyltransferase [Annulohypoxylon maeteangense]KAI0889188.1 S-adenosyl-L-methionine-dependent methyltransferase [Annulohypoxylon maeteangense]